MSRYRTAIFVTTGTPDAARMVAKQLHERFPHLAVTLLTPQSFCSGIDGADEILTFEEIKKSPLRGIIALRRRHFDLCVVIFSNDPCFRRSRFAALGLNARRTIIYNGNCDSFVVDRRHWRDFYAHVVGRRRTWRAPSFFVPFGLAYLLARTCWMITKARFRATNTADLKSSSTPALPHS